MVRIRSDAAQRHELEELETQEREHVQEADEHGRKWHAVHCLGEHGHLQERQQDLGLAHEVAAASLQVNLQAKMTFDCDVRTESIEEI